MSDYKKPFGLAVAALVIGFLGLAFLAYTIFGPRHVPVDSRVIMGNGTQVVIFVTSDKVEERLKGLRMWFRIVSIDNDGGLFTIVIETREHGELD